jgi:D-alanyl-D-alanine carboxypeptidase/D-alanyl-D-alanine-endopeptidase (penicillin-binding protein 4)
VNVARRAAAWSRLGWCLLACACAAVPRTPVEAAVAELVQRTELDGGRVGVVVVDAADGRVLAAHAAERGFATASNLKLVTAAVALWTLGPAATLATRLERHGEVRDGVLHGDLVLVGGGDPSLGGDADPRPAALLAAVARAGIRRVTGAVVGDGRWLGEESLGLGWQWDYLDDDYAAPFGGLCWAGNVVELTVAPAPGGPTLAWRPRSAAVEGRLAVARDGEPTRIRARRGLGRSAIEVEGVMRADAEPWTGTLSVQDPALAAAAEFAAQLAVAGVVVDGGVRRAAPGAAGSEAGRTLATEASAPVGDLVAPMLRRSDNLHAEQLWRASARVAAGDGSTTAAARHAEAVLREHGVDPAGMVLADGSGLSRRNLVRPRQLADLLLALHRSPLREPFVVGLPVAGVSGTLRSRFAAGPAHGRVRAKTGYIARVVCLSGYVPRPDPGAAPLVFCIMLNDFTCSDAAAKAAVDACVQRLARIAGWPEPLP